MTGYLFDASAVLAYVFSEKGADIAEKYLTSASLSAINLSEVIQKISQRTKQPAEVLNSPFNIIDVNEDIALKAAQIYDITSKSGLSMAHRICLATALYHKLPVITADRQWLKLALPLKIIPIR